MGTCASHSGGQGRNAKSTARGRIGLRRTATVRLLMGHGADANRDVRAVTPLMLSVQRGCVSVLLETGAKVGCASALGLAM